VFLLCLQYLFHSSVLTLLNAIATTEGIREWRVYQDLVGGGRCVVPVLILDVAWRKENHNILNLDSTISSLDISKMQVLDNTVAPSLIILREFAEQLFKLVIISCIRFQVFAIVKV
jgi:hypothetical protein